MCIVLRDMCTKFHLKMLNFFFSYEVRLKFCNDTDDDVKGITIPKIFPIKNRLAENVKILYKPKFNY